ncbi:hypothetical protein B0H13DRAFT_2518540, partial [Mycena leptocephala]
MEDLNKALQLAAESVELMPVDHTERPSCLQCLAVLLGERYQALGNISDLEQALGVARSCVQVSAADHLQCYFLCCLAMLLTEIYKVSKEVHYLDEGLKVARDSVKLAPDFHPERPACLHGLSALLSEKYSKFKDIRFLNQALEMSQESVKFLPRKHRDRLGYLRFL